jgi:hypothetical protein
MADRLCILCEHEPSVADELSELFFFFSEVFHR